MSNTEIIGALALEVENAVLRELLNTIPLPGYRETMPHFRKRYAAWEKKRVAAMDKEKVSDA